MYIRHYCNFNNLYFEEKIKIQTWVFYNITIESNYLTYIVYKY